MKVIGLFFQQASMQMNQNAEITVFSSFITPVILQPLASFKRSASDSCVRWTTSISVTLMTCIDMSMNPLASFCNVSALKNLPGVLHIFYVVRAQLCSKTMSENSDLSTHTTSWVSYITSKQIDVALGGEKSSIFFLMPQNFTVKHVRQRKPNFAQLLSLSIMFLSCKTAKGEFLLDGCGWKPSFSVLFLGNCQLGLEPGRTSYSLTEALAFGDSFMDIWLLKYTPISAI